MNARRNIDERDIDRLLSALSDHQIAELFGLTETEVFELRRKRRRLETERLLRRDQHTEKDE